MLAKETASVSETKYSCLTTALAVARELACVQVFQFLFPKRKFEEGQITPTHAVGYITGEHSELKERIFVIMGSKYSSV